MPLPSTSLVASNPASGRFPGASRISSVDPGLVARMYGDASLAARNGMLNQARQIEGVTTSDWLGPLQPLAPFAPQGTGWRTWDYPVGINIRYQPRQEGPVPLIGFEELRFFSRNVDICRIIIENRKQQFQRQNWQFMLKDGDPDETDPRIEMLNRMFEEPDPVGGVSFSNWMGLLLEEMLTIDAPCVFIQRGKDGKPVAFRHVDGSTIKILVNLDGSIPMPPSPAYQQIVKGVPIVDLDRSQLFYAPRNLRPDFLYGYCYSDDTEVLTKRGWLKFSEVDVSTDEFATRDIKTKRFEWQKATHQTIQPYDGELYHFHSRAVDLLVTPEHRMLLTGMPRKLGGGSGQRSWQHSREHAGDAVVTARELAGLGKLNPNLKIPMTSLWSGVEVPSLTFDMDPVRRAERITASCSKIVGQGNLRTRLAKVGMPLTMSGDDFCAFMGMYLSEGWLNHGEKPVLRNVFISQRKESKGFEPFRQLLTRILGKEPSYNGIDFIVSRSGLAEYLDQFGDCYHKFIPEVIMNATPKQVRIFWNYFMLGDGHLERPRRPHKSGRRGALGGIGQRITTTSKRMADQLVELAQKMGLSASLRIRPASFSPHRIAGNRNLTVAVAPSYVISLRGSSAMGFKISTVPYSGKVYCVTVPNGFLYVRRNGKPAWSGNSPVESIISTLNLFLRREIYRIQYYSAANQPAGLLELPANITNEQIQQIQEWMDISLKGNTADRWLMRNVPNGTKYQEIRPPQLQDTLDEWVAQIVCYAFGVPPTPFMLMRGQARANAESARDQSKEEGLAPLIAWFSSFVTKLIYWGWGWTDIKFGPVFAKENDPQIQANIHKIYLGMAVLNVNEVREDLGREPIEGGDEYRIYESTGPIPLSTADDMAAASLQSKQNGSMAFQSGGRTGASQNASEGSSPQDNPNPSSADGGAAAAKVGTRASQSKVGKTTTIGRGARVMRKVERMRFERATPVTPRQPDFVKVGDLLIPRNVL